MSQPKSKEKSLGKIQKEGAAARAVALRSKSAQKSKSKHVASKFPKKKTVTNKRGQVERGGGQVSSTKTITNKKGQKVNVTKTKDSSGRTSSTRSKQITNKKGQKVEVRKTKDSSGRTASTRSKDTTNKKGQDINVTKSKVSGIGSRKTVVNKQTGNVRTKSTNAKGETATSKYNPRDGMKRTNNQHYAAATKHYKRQSQ